jgi:tripartite-type tricarboxylate transporter receptor subunit TctC
MRKVLIALLLAFSIPALAQPYPSKAIRMAVAFPPGGPVDIIARLMGPKLSELLGQSIIVENVVGASGNIASRNVAKAAPDGYTILVHSSAYAVNPSLSASAGYDAERDFVALAVVASQPNMIVVHADFPARTLGDLLARAKTEKLSFAHAGNGTTPHLTGENLFRVRSKLDITNVPFKGGGPATTAVLTGQPPLGVIAGAAPMPHVRSGKLRALAVSSARRLASIPDVPTLTELGFPDMEDYTWVGYFAPAGTPPDIARRLNEAILKVAADPLVKERLEAAAFEITAQPLPQTAAYVKSEVAKWARVVKETGAKVD